MSDNVAQNLIKLRVAKKFTQEALAEKAGISLLAYRNMESGKSEPSINSLTKIAEVYQIDIGEFFQKYQSQILKVRFRALEKKNIRKREEIIYEVDAWLKKYNKLISDLNLTDEYKYKLKYLETETTNPIQMAKIAREAFGLQTQETVKDICNLIEFRAGIKILAKQFNSDSFFGLSLEDINQGKVIVVNTWDRISVERRIFSIAHELGHILLHFNSVQNNLTSEDKTEEKEANQFASHFLMPQEDFIKVWNSSANNDFVERVIRVKQIFRVSYQVVLYRLSEYVKENDINFDVWKFFNISYMRKYKVKIDRTKELNSVLDTNSRELRALSNQFYASGRLAELVKKAVDKNIINLDTAADILNISVKDVENFKRIWDDNPLYELK